MCSRHSSLGLDPVQVVLGPGESSGHANLTSSRCSKGDNSDLGPLVTSGLATSLLHQGATRVTIARSTASSSVNADDSISNDAVDVVAVRVADNWDVPHLPEDWGDPTGAVCGLAPSGHCDQGTDGGGLSGSGQARGGDVVVHGQRAGKLDEGKISGQVVAVPQGVGPAVVGGDLNTVRLAGLPHVVGSGHDVEVAGAIGTVGSGQDVVLRDDGTTAEPGVIDEESHPPGPGVLGGLNSSNDPSLLDSGTLDSTGSLGLSQVLLVGWGGRGPHLSSHTVDLLHQVVAVGIDHGGPGLVLAEVTALCWPPVLLRTKPAALRGSTGNSAERGDNEEPHVVIQ